MFNINQPQNMNGLVNAKLLNGIAAGKSGKISANDDTTCAVDSFVVSSPGHTAPPVICGQNNGQHSKSEIKHNCQTIVSLYMQFQYQIYFQWLWNLQMLATLWLLTLELAWWLSTDSLTSKWLNSVVISLIWHHKDVQNTSLAKQNKSCHTISMVDLIWLTKEKRYASGRITKIYFFIKFDL